MKNINYLLLLGLLVMGRIQANELDDALEAASGKAEPTSASSSELQSFKDKVSSALKGAVVSDWDKITLDYTHHADYDTVQELPKSRHGRGYFAINPQAKNNWLLQAPHADSDLHTGKIASRLFLTGAFRAAQWNTVHRDVSDMAHSPDTYWQAYTQAFAELYPEGKIIQIHGFDQDNRKSEEGSNSDMILSAGNKNPPDWLQQTASCLKKAMPLHVSLYPFDVKELGGTKNVQGQLLMVMGYGGFVHIEMSGPMRMELLNNAETRKRFIACL